MKATDTGIKRILQAFKYSYDGFTATFRSEAAFRQDLLFCLLCSFVALWLDVAWAQKCWLLSSLMLILLAELVNTAVETVIDRISEEYHELSKKAKDIGSLIVLLAFINAVVVWSAVLPQLWQQLTRLF